LAVKIRLMRVGKKKQPSYRVVVTDARSPRDGRFIEVLGQYAPRAEPSVVSIDSDRALHWLRVGAQPTEQVAKLLEITGVWAAYKAAVGKDAVAKPKAKNMTAKSNSLSASDRILRRTLDIEISLLPETSSVFVTAGAGYDFQLRRVAV